MLSSCGQEQHELRDAITTQKSLPSPVVRATSQPVHWSYEGEEGPDKWGELSPAYQLCSEGHQQSPINLPSNAPAGSVATWSTVYGETELDISHTRLVDEIVNNGHTIEVACEDGSILHYNGVEYHLRQFHFHTPSEHKIDGTTYPLEAHFVHQSSEGKLAVIGVLFSTRFANPTEYDKFIGVLPKKPGTTSRHPNVRIKLEELLPIERSAYHYVGSLTSPPCTEGVQWLVLRQPVYVRARVILHFLMILPNNNRPIQESFGRPIDSETPHPHG